jgi:hypothetical protein
MSDQTKRDEILEKVRKLHAHAESAAEIGNEAEAQTFAAKVQELLTAYKLSMADIGSGDRAAPEPINMTYVFWEEMGLNGRATRQGWTEVLGQLIADAYYCKFVICRGRYFMGEKPQGWPDVPRKIGHSTGFFVGTDTDRKIAQYMYVTLGRFLYHFAERESKKFRYQCWVDSGKPDSGAAPMAAGFKAGFVAGFLQRLSDRFDEEVKPKASVTASNTAAIVLVKKNSLARVQTWCDENLELKKCRMAAMNDGSQEGRHAGKKAANDLDLGSKTIAGSKVRTKELR